MDEDVKGGGSYAWQSILKAREVINLGSIWWIGDGKKWRFEVINGYLTWPPIKSFPLKRACLWILGFMPLSMRMAHAGWNTRLSMNFYPVAKDIQDSNFHYPNNRIIWSLSYNKTSPILEKKKMMLTIFLLNNEQVFLSYFFYFFIFKMKTR